MKQAKKLKGTNVYVNDHLTKKNADIAKEARLLRKQSHILATWVWNCRIWIRQKEGMNAVQVKSIKDLEKYKSS